MRDKRSSLNGPIIATAVLGVILTIYIVYIVPSTVAVIGGFVVLSTLFVYMTASLFAPKKESILMALFTFLFLISSYVAGFSLINTIILASFIIGIRLLIR